MFKKILTALFFINFIIIAGTMPMAYAQQFFTLPNGLQIVIDEDDRFPLVSLRLYVRAGAAHEGQGEEGISHFLEHMVFKGTETRAPGQVAREIEEAGGYLNAATSFDYTVYTIDLPSQEWKLGLDIIHDMIFGSIFDPHELNLEKSVVLAEIERSMDNPGSRVFRAVQSMIFQDTPYEHPILGFKETVKALTRDDLLAYMDRKYQPARMVLSVSGNIKIRDVLNEAAELFSSVPGTSIDYRTSAIELAHIKTKEPGQRAKVDHGPWRKAYMAAAVPAPPLNSPDAAAFDMLAYLLGGDRTSLFYRKFKYDLGIVDQISASVLSLERTGLIYFYSQLDPDKVEPFWEKFLEVMAKLDAQDFTDQQINRAIANIEEGIFRARETVGGKASRLGFQQLFDNDPLAEEKYLHSLRRVTRQDLQDIIQSSLLADNMVVGAVVPQQASMLGDILAAHLEKHSAGVQEKYAQAQEAQEGKEVIELGQGRKLILIHDNHLPHTAVNIAWPGGNRLVSPDMQGLPDLSARTLTRETQNRSFEQIQDFLRDRASSVNASASRDSFSVSARFPVQYSSDIMSLVSEIILEPSFSGDELRRAVNEQIADIRQQEDRPLGYAFRHLFPFLFSQGAYSYLQLGNEDFLRTASPENLGAFWEKQRSMPFAITICGSIDREALDSMVAELKQIEPATDQASHPTIMWSDIRTKDIVMDDRAQAHILMVFPIPGKTHEHTPALNVLNKVLAGQGGLLFRELRDRQGLAYSVTSLMWQTPEAGFLALYIGTYEDRVDDAVNGFKGVIEDLQSRLLEPDEINRASRLIFGEYHRGRQTISSRAAEASSLVVQGLDLNFRLEMTDRVGQVTPDDIRTMTDEYLDLNRSYLMRIIPG